MRDGSPKSPSSTMSRSSAAARADGAPFTFISKAVAVADSDRGMEEGGKAVLSVPGVAGRFGRRCGGWTVVAASAVGSGIS